MIEEFFKLGWKLVPIRPMSKVPRGKHWNERDHVLRSVDDLQPGEGVGLAHAYSGTMALDIDNFKEAANYLKGFGISLKDLCLDPKAVCIESGVVQRGKLLYRVPEPLFTKSIKINGVTVLEFLCATRAGLTSKNVLPPSIHPTTKVPYTWSGYGNFRELPDIPFALLDLWKKLTEIKPHRDGSEVNVKEIMSALEAIPADLDRDSWIRIGMALHEAAANDSLFEVWDEWSKGSEDKYPGIKQMLYQWNSFEQNKNDAVTLGTLFEIAKQYGWMKPNVDVSNFFSAVASESEMLEPTTVASSQPLVRPVDVYDMFEKPLPDPLIDLWPEVLRNQANSISTSIGCDPLVTLYAGLSAVCAAVDARTRLELVPGFKVPPILWLMTIGDPADKKTPASRPMFSTLYKMEMEDRPRYNGAITLFELSESRYATAKKDIHNKLKIALLDPFGTDTQSDEELVAELPELGPKPTELRLFVKDITSQKLVRTGADNPRGFICYLDEMASWMRKITDKTSGEDRSAWVVAYEGDSYTMDRVGCGTIRCDSFSVGIYGNIQPNMLRQHADLLTADGLLQRFMPGCLRPGLTRRGEPVPNQSSEAYDLLLRKLYALPVNDYSLSPEAYELFREFQTKYEQRKQDERMIGSDTVFMTAFGKLEGLCGRLMLLFHLIEDPYSSKVSGSIAARVIRLVNEFVIPSMRYAFVDLLGVKSYDRWMVDYVATMSDSEMIRLPEMRRAIISQLKIKDTAFVADGLMVATKLLEKTHWLFRADDGRREHQGYAEWTVNPYLREMTETRRQKIADAMDRVKNNRY